MKNEINGEYYFVRKVNCAQYFASVTASDADTVSPLKFAIYLAHVNYTVHTSEKMGTQPFIELFSPRKSWPNSKCECSHLIQYNPLFSE